MAVGHDLKCQNAENDDKSGSKIGFVREYLGIYHHYILKGAARKVMYQCTVCSVRVVSIGKSLNRITVDAGTRAGE